MPQKIFEATRVVRMHDTDATGVIYFTHAFRYACDSFEEALESSGFALKREFEAGELAFPIVAASSQYFAPLRLCQRVKIELFLESMGQKSFSLLSKIFFDKESVLACQVAITHACVSKKTQKSCKIPDYFKTLFNTKSS